MHQQVLLGAGCLNERPGASAVCLTNIALDTAYLGHLTDVPADGRAREGSPGHTHPAPVETPDRPAPARGARHPRLKASREAVA